MSHVRQDFPLNPIKISKIPFVYYKQIKEKKNCKNSDIGQDFTEFAKIRMLEYLHFFNKKKGYFGNFDQI